MHWSRIFVFAFLLIIFQVTPSTITSYLWGIPEEVTQLRFWGEFLASAIMAFIVFVMAGFLHFPKPYTQAFISSVVAYLVIKATVSIFIGEFSYNILSFTENVLTLIAMFSGTYIGLKLNKCSVT